MKRFLECQQQTANVPQSVKLITQTECALRGYVSLHYIFGLSLLAHLEHCNGDQGFEYIKWFIVRCVGFFIFFLTGRVGF